MTLAKNALFLLIQRFDNWLEPPLQHPGLNFLWRLRSVIACSWTHSPVPSIKKGNHDPSLTFSRHCPRPPCNTKELCQSRLPRHVQSLSHSRAIVDHSKLFNYPDDICQGDGRVLTPKSSNSPVDDKLAGFKEILKVLRPSPNNIFSLGQQFTSQAKPKLGWTLLPLSESPNSLPEHP